MSAAPLLSEWPAGLDRRLLKAIARLGWQSPTRVQLDTLSAALRGDDLAVTAPTGSGKTAAYGLSVLQTLLASKADGKKGERGSDSVITPHAVILVPTRELVDQTVAALSSLAYYCTDLVTMIAVGGASSGSLREQAARLSDGADIIVSTPARLVDFIQSRKATGGVKVSLKACRVLVVDEADMLLSFGYEAELKAVIGDIPPAGCQNILLSATLSSQLDGIRRILLHKPTIIQIGDGADRGRLSQFYLRVGFKSDRFLLMYALLKLRLVAGRTLIFVNDVPAAFKLKLFLERFSIQSAVLNAELPANSRAHILASFNKGVVDLLIATDESVAASIVEAAAGGAVAGGKRKRAAADAAVAATGAGGGDEGVDAAPTGKRSRGDGSGSGGIDDVAVGRDGGAEGDAATATATAAGSKGKGRRGPDFAKDTAFGVGRGLDFQNVATVVNFDFPKDSAAYVHRIGRTARGGAAGVALTFIEPEGMEPGHDSVLATLQAVQPPDSTSGQVQPSALPFNVAEVEGFRYRVEDVLGGITEARVREARLADIRGEILASEALKAHFEDNPRDADLLQRIKHDKYLAPGAVKPHLKDVPDYLLPPALRAAVEAAGAGISAAARIKRKAKQEAREAASGRPIAKTPTTLEEAVKSRSRVSASQMVALSQHDAYHARRNNVDPLKAFAAGKRS